MSKSKIFLACASLLLLQPAVSHASQIKPGSPEGLRLVHQAATQISQEFVAQTNQLQGQGENDIPDCEMVKSKVLENLSALDLNGAYDLAIAKKNLESTSCESADRKKINDKFFIATLSIRAFEDIN